MSLIWKDWPTLEEQRRAMQATNPDINDRPFYDPSKLTCPVALDPLPDVIEGYLADAGELVLSGGVDLPRVRINTEAWQKGGYKRDETVEFPALRLLTDADEERAFEQLDRVDRLVRRYVPSRKSGTGSSAMASNATAGGVTPGQKRFFAELGNDRGALGLVARAVAGGNADDLTSQKASALIGRMQSARSPKPALRIKPARPPRPIGERANKKRRRAA